MTSQPDESADTTPRKRAWGQASASAPDQGTVHLPRRGLPETGGASPPPYAGATALAPRDRGPVPATLPPQPPAPPAPAVPVEEPRKGMVSDLDLNGTVPPRAVPVLGDWGPDEVVSTRAKRRQRWVVPVLFVVALVVVGVAWRYFWLRLG
ncbi:hypothetical protein GCM10027418_13180 [Mariniluteicoccus endophyticus]